MISEELIDQAGTALRCMAHYDVGRAHMYGEMLKMAVEEGEEDAYKSVLIRIHVLNMASQN